MRQKPEGKAVKIASIVIDNSNARSVFVSLYVKYIGGANRLFDPVRRQVQVNLSLIG